MNALAAFILGLGLAALGAAISTELVCGAVYSIGG